MSVAIYGNRAADSCLDSIQILRQPMIWIITVPTGAEIETIETLAPVI
jgi:hypothetical protein